MNGVATFSAVSLLVAHDAYELVASAPGGAADVKVAIDKVIAALEDPDRTIGIVMGWAWAFGKGPVAGITTWYNEMTCNFSLIHQMFVAPRGWDDYREYQMARIILHKMFHGIGDIDGVSPRVPDPANPGESKDAPEDNPEYIVQQFYPGYSPPTPSSPSGSPPLPVGPGSSPPPSGMGPGR